MGNSLIQYKDYAEVDNTRLTAIDVSNCCPLPVQDPWLSHAVSVIEATYGDKVSVGEKNKDLLKFGTTSQCQTTLTTIMDLPVGTYNETYISDNLITTLSSSNNSDTVEVGVEGHTIDESGNFTFVTQTITLTGQTQASLTTPLARCTRLYNNNSTDLQGTIYAYQDDTSTAGVPNTSTKVHCMIPLGYNQSRKASTTLSSVDYWIVTNWGTGVNEKVSAFVDTQIEIRLKDKVFRAAMNITASSGVTSDHFFGPYLIIPPNSDIRLRSKTGSNNQEVTGRLQGVLAIIT